MASIFMDVDPKPEAYEWAEKFHDAYTVAERKIRKHPVAEWDSLQDDDKRAIAAAMQYFVGIEMGWEKI